MSRLRINPSEYETIVTLYNSGVSKEQLQKRYQVSNSVIDRILRINNVTLRDRSHMSRQYTLNEHYFDIIDTPNKAYILGLLYADGCNIRNTNTIKLELQERDKNILDKINAELDSNRPLKLTLLHEKNLNWQNSYKLSITNKHMSETLDNHGLVANKSLVLQFPTWLNKNLMPHFIRGYVDGDGYLGLEQNNKLISIASSKSFCIDLQSYLLSHYQIKSVMYNKESLHEQIQVLHIMGKDNITKFLNIIYENAELYIERKYDSYTKFINHVA